MRLDANTVLVTGGASGIGLAIAERFARAGSQVVVCGRRADKLEEARRKVPALETRVCDLSREADRTAFCGRVVQEFPRLNVLVNNAGIQVHAALTEPASWTRFREELATNLEAPIHLSMLLIPHLRSQPRAAIWNVASGLSFVPMARAPVYSATKAAIHSFTLSLRHQLGGTPIEVIEVIPPAVNTDLGGVGLHAFGVGVDEFVDAVMARIEKGENEVAYGFSQQTSQASRAELGEVFRRLNESAH
ncbi:MAG TPA: SDR family NAD(P)-dependent oxidoreductase [Thermoanaerobaculia bacterium]|nr:SDR family NAD(P)-dependent oxidoreductase [Thermoanaerobaculia bacterium]